MVSKDDIVVRAYHNDHRPPHVHVFFGAGKYIRQKKEVLIALATSDEERPYIYEIRGVAKERDARRALEVVCEMHSKFLKKWRKISQQKTNSSEESEEEQE